MRLRFISALLIALSPAGVGAAAETDVGARLADSCTSCHGAAGSGGGTIPALAGQDEKTLAARLQALAAGDPETTIMPRIMRAYDAAEIAALARYFAGVEK